MLRMLRLSSGAAARRQGGLVAARSPSWTRFLSQQAPPEEPPKSEKEIAELMQSYLKENMETSVTPAHVRAVPDGMTQDAEVRHEVATLDGMPRVHRDREVIISQSCKTAMQQATGKTKPWHIKWEPWEVWTNPMMGWTSSADSMQQVDLQFDTQEQAVRFAEKRGWKYRLKAPIERFEAKGENKYALNFLPKAYENEIKALGKKTKIFARPRANASHYFRPLKYHGDGECPQHGLNATENWKDI